MHEFRSNEDLFGGPARTHAMSIVQGTASAPGRFRFADPLTTGALLKRCAVLWLVVRVTLTLLGVFTGGGIVFSPAVIPFLAAAVGAVALADLRTVRDDLFLANLGVGGRHVFGLAFVIACIAELALSILFAAVRA